MAVKLSQLKPAIGSRKKGKRIGRGNNSSDPGTYSGRGMKGQRSRSGGKKGLKVKGLKSILKSFPKKKGFKRHFCNFDKVINLSYLEKKFKEGDIIDIKKLREAGILKKKDGRIKILGRGELNKKLTVQAHAFSDLAKKMIEKAGGKVVISPSSKNKKVKK